MSIDYTTYGLGCIKDKYDPRDYILEVPAGANSGYPLGFKLESMPIKNQNSINSCVAHACATIKEIQEFYDTGKKLQFSTGWIYGYRLDNHYQGQGMYPKEAMSMLCNYGDVLYNSFPENFEYDQLKSLISNRKNDCLNEAKQYKLKSYARCLGLPGVKYSIYCNHSPVMIIIDVYSNFYNVNYSGVVSDKSGNYCGSHAMVIVGWTLIGNKEYYIVQNSWGSEWGDNGYCYIEPNNSIITDLYTSVDETNISKTFSDVSNGKHWAEKYIDKCVKAGLINGYTDGTFKPNNTITRAEICTMFAKMLDK